MVIILRVVRVSIAVGVQIVLSSMSRCKTLVRCSNPKTAVNMYIMNICTSVMHVCKTPVKCSNPKTAVNKYDDRSAAKVRVRSKKHSYAEIVVSTVCVYSIHRGRGH